jgi:hypothetical protein
MEQTDPSYSIDDANASWDRLYDQYKTLRKAIVAEREELIVNRTNLLVTDRHYKFINFWFILAFGAVMMYIYM